MPYPDRHKVTFLPRLRPYPVKGHGLLQVSQHALAHQPVTSPPVQSIMLTVANTVECVALIGAGLSMLGLSNMACHVSLVHGPEIASSAAPCYAVELCMSDQRWVQGNHGTWGGGLSSAQFMCVIFHRGLAHLQYSPTSLPLLHAKGWSASTKAVKGLEPTIS